MASAKKEIMKCGVCRQKVCYANDLDFAFTHECLKDYEDLLIENKYLYGRRKLIIDHEQITNQSSAEYNPSSSDPELEDQLELDKLEVGEINEIISDEETLTSSVDQNEGGGQVINNENIQHTKNQGNGRALLEHTKEMNMKQRKKLKDQDSLEESDESIEEMNEKQKNKWSSEQIHVLIDGYKANRHKFDSPQYNAKQVWNLVSKHLKEKGIDKNGTKCSEKWRNMKKMYENVKKHNKQTGNDRKTWIFYERLDEIYFKNPSINPIATVSSTGKKTNQGNNEPVGSEKLKRRCSTKDSGDEFCSSNKNPSIREYPEASAEGSSIEHKETSRSKQKKTSKMLCKSRSTTEGKEKRHKERLEQKEKMFSWFKNFMTSNKSE